MKLFWKSRNNKSQQSDITNVASPTPQSPNKKKNPLHTWWQENCQGEVPLELETILREMAETEADRRRLAEKILSPIQLQRNDEARRLALTKKRNIEESLQQVEWQQEWLRQYRAFTQEYNEHRNRLYEATKRLKSMANDERELGRFESFESILGRFLRMQILTLQSRQLKETNSALIHEADAQAHSEQESVKKVTQKMAERAEKDVAMARAQELYGEACKVEGVRDVLDLCTKKTTRLLERMQESLTQLKDEYRELRNNTDEQQRQLNAQKALAQNLLPHRQMVEHGELIMEKLNRMEELGTELGRLKQKYNKSMTDQHAENEMLGQVYTQYQAIENEIHTLNDEITMHRHNNAGHVGYALQERAMRLKIRKQQLLSARFLWKRIWAGYVYICELEQLVNSLRLDLAATLRNIETLEPEVASMQKRCREKEYTLTLSKSQNVIQLRGDLKEGVSCTVCGATHHPYHSDTMLEQSKLLGEIRTEFELMQSELIGKQNALQEQLKRRNELEVSLELQRKVLKEAKNNRMEDVNEWQAFAMLDPSFADCSSSTNMEARMVMIQQLIESTNQEEEAAQKDLDAYNFHQARIIELSESLTAREQRLAELTARLNELNTGCQVMAGRCERLSARHNTTQSAYTHLFEELNALISLPDWLNEWKASHEGLKMHINQMMKQWNEIRTGIATIEQQLQVSSALSERYHRQIQVYESFVLQLADGKEQYETLAEQSAQTLRQIVGEQDTHSFLAKHVEQQKDSLRAEAEALEATAQLRIAHANVTGRMQAIENLSVQIDKRIVEVRSDLDIWIRQYNASHPPVQYAELQAIFEQEKDWTETRAAVRQAQTTAAMEQEKVNNLQSRILSLKAENTGTAAPDANTENSLAMQHDSLQRQLANVLMHIAQLELTLKLHKESVTDENED